MNVKRWMWTGALLAASLVPMALAAQQPKREFLVVYEDHVKPSMAGPYEASTKEMIKALGDAKAASPSFEMMTLMYDDFTYIYLTPLKNYALLDSMESDWQAVSEKVGKDRWKQIMSSMDPSVNSSTQMIAEHLPDLSFHPSTPRLKESEMGYVVDDYLYVIPGKQDEFRGLCKQMAELAKSKGVNNAWEVYQVVFGEEMPFYVVGGGAKDAADFAEWEKKDNFAMGEEGKALLAKIVALCRKFERRTGWMRADLSYHVPVTEFQKAMPPQKK